MSIATPPRPASRKKPREIEFRAVLTGDQRVTENFIVEVCAIAQRCGLEIPNVQVVRQRKIGSKMTKKTKKKVRPRRGTRP